MTASETADLIAAHAAALTLFARQWCDSPEDAVQDAFLRAHKAFDRFRGNDGRAWLLAIVRNVCYSQLRQNRREPEEVAFEDEIHGSTEDPANANAVAWHEIKSELLRKGLERLPPEFREVIVLHEIEEMTAPMIAQVLTIPLNTVYSRLRVARVKLEEALARQGVEP